MTTEVQIAQLEDQLARYIKLADNSVLAQETFALDRIEQIKLRISALKGDTEICDKCGKPAEKLCFGTCIPCTMADMKKRTARKRKALGL